MRWDEALWSRDPEEWEPWQVLVGRLLEAGDVRGQLLEERFRLFRPEQAAAVAAYGAMLANRTMCETWTRRAMAGP